MYIRYAGKKTKSINKCCSYYCCFCMRTQSLVWGIFLLITQPEILMLHINVPVHSVPVVLSGNLEFTNIIWGGQDVGLQEIHNWCYLGRWASFSSPVLCPDEDALVRSISCRFFFPPIETKGVSESEISCPVALHQRASNLYRTPQDMKSAGTCTRLVLPFRPAPCSPWRRVIFGSIKKTMEFKSKSLPA